MKIRVVLRGQTDERTDVMKLIVTFRNLAKAPNWYFTKSIDISLEAYSALNVTVQHCAPACFTQNVTAHTNLQVLISRYRGCADCRSLH